MGKFKSEGMLFKTVWTLDKRKYFEHTLHKGMCDNLINSLKLLTNQQKDGESPLENIVTDLLEKSRKAMMDGPRKFIAVDNHEAVEVGGLRRGMSYLYEAVKVGGLQVGTKSSKVVKQKFTADFPGVIREGADELTLQAHEVGVRRTCIDTAYVVDHRWEPPVVDADWHAFCQAVYRGTEGQEWQAMYYHYKELHQTAKSKNHGDNQKANALWAMKAARDREDEYYDPNHQKK